jgi:transcriptional regulator with XRE-family HTH domain
MNKEEFKKLYQSKGWTQKELAERWGFSTDSRIRQIQSDPHKNPYFIDAIIGLPTKKTKNKS